MSIELQEHRSEPWRHVTARLDEQRKLARLAKRLSVLTLVWLGIEGALGVAAGVAAGSIALVAFGLDSAIEGLASILVVWRFSGSRTTSPAAERRAQQGVAVSFYLLAPYVAAESVKSLLDGSGAAISRLGIALTVATLLICPALGFAKRRIAVRLGSGAVGGEGEQNLFCAGLASGVLVGLVANAVFGLWWVDPVVALAIAVACVQEGRKAWQGKTCGCASCAAPLTSE